MLAFLGLSISVLAYGPSDSNSENMIVGPLEVMTSIQEAIDNAESGDTIEVLPGEYHENVFIPEGKMLNLEGSGYEVTHIIGDGTTSTMFIQADGCKVSGFGISRSGVGASDAGIFVDSNGNTIELNNASRNRIGIILNQSNGNTIQKNIVDSNYGILNIDDGLVGHWNMDESKWDGTTDEVRDLSGNDNHGTATGAVNVYPGRNDKAGKFDGVNDDVQVPDDATLDLTRWTVSTWVYFEDFNSNYMRIIDKRRDGYNDYYVNYKIFAKNIDNEINHGFAIGGSSTSNQATLAMDDIEAKTWYLVVGRYDGTEIMLDVIGDGVHLSDRTSESGTPYTTGSQALSMGIKNTGAGREDFFKGKMDDVRVYDHAFSDQQVLALFTEGEGAGIRVWDSSNNDINNNTILNNTGSGIQMLMSNSNTVQHNKIERNFQDGIQVDDSHNNVIRENDLSDNRAVAVPTDGLLGYWKMDEFAWSGSSEEVKDSSGWGKNGTTYNGPTMISNSIHGRGGRLDGFNDYIEIEDESHYDVDEECSISAWINKDQQTYSHTKPIINKADNGGSLYHTFGINIRTTGVLRGRTTEGSTDLIVDSSYILAANQWYFFTMVIKESYLELYVNGVLEDRVTKSFTPVDNNAPVRIGWNPTYATNYCFDGLIDEVSIHNRALSHNEILSMYTAGRSGTIDLQLSNNNQIYNNSIDMNQGAGMVLLESDSNNITDNYIMDNSGSGIYADFSSNNNIQSNNINSNNDENTRFQSGLKGWWRMDESTWTGTAGDVKDTSGRNNHGRSMGGISPDDGRFKNAGDFDGSNDYIDCSTDTDYDMTEAISIEAWAKTDGTPTGIQSITSKDLSTSQRSYNLFGIHSDNSNKPMGRIIVEDGGNGVDLDVDATTDTRDGEWHHYVLTYATDTGDAILYIDGVEEDRTTDSSKRQIQVSNANFNIGRRTTGDRWFDGMIDEVCLWNRSLSPKEVYDHYTDGVMGGIHLRSSDNTDIKYNMVQNHPDYAIRTNEGSSSNTILNNYLINNDQPFKQAHDDGTSNTWSNVNGGNLWDDWTTPDTDATPGIVDIPYDLEGIAGTQDQKPLCLAIQGPLNLTPVKGSAYSDACTYINAYQPGSFNFHTNAGWLTCNPDGTMSGTPPLDAMDIYWVNASISDVISSKFINFTLILGDNFVEVINLTISDPVIYRNNGIKAEITVVDHLQQFQLAQLIPTLQHKHENAGTWSETYVTGINANLTTGKWEVDVFFPSSCQVGDYSFRANCSNPLGDISEWFNCSEELTVLNNLPTAPTIEIMNKTPKAKDPITCAITSPGTDVETNPLNYNYRWYLDDSLVRNVTITDLEDTLESSLLLRGTEVECRVRAVDDLNVSAEVSDSVTVLNGAPYTLVDVLYRTYEEDAYANPINLNLFIQDPDGDNLVFSADISSNFTVMFDAFGMVQFISKANWNGNESATIYASDGLNSTSLTIWLNILPINDDPILDPISDLFMTQGDEKTVQLVGSDPMDDGTVTYGIDVFTAIDGITTSDYTFSNLTGLLVINATNEMVGVYEVTAWAEDTDGAKAEQKFNVTIYNLNDRPGSVTIIEPGDGEQFDHDAMIVFDVTFVDADVQHGQVITFTWSSNVSGTLSANKTFQLDSLPSGYHEIKVEAFDGEFTVSDTVSIYIRPEPKDPTTDGGSTDGGSTDGGTTDGNGTDGNVTDPQDGADGGSFMSSWLMVLIIILVIIIILAIAIFIVARMVMAKERGDDIDEDDDALIPDEDGDDIFEQKVKADAVSGSGRRRGKKKTIDIDVDEETELHDEDGDELDEPPKAVGDPDRMLEDGPLALPEGEDVPDEEMVEEEIDALDEDEPKDIASDDDAVDEDISLDYEKPEEPPEAQFMVDPVTAKNDPDVYHEDSGNVWTPDMAGNRTAAESKQAIEALKELSVLHEQGILSDEEFAQKKRQLLKKI